MNWEEIGYLVNPNIWLSPKDAAKHFNCGLQTLYNWKSQGKFRDEDILETDRKWYVRKDAPLFFPNVGRRAAKQKALAAE